jgi:hypothetical protein
MDAKYKLVPEAIPPISKSTLYEQILGDFLGGKVASVRVDVPSKKPSTVLQGLLKVKRTDRKFASIGVVRRGETIYLKK